VHIATVGLNHKTAPVIVREKLSIGANVINDALEQLNAHPAIHGCVIISTCNRMEVYAAADEIEEGLKAIREFLSSRSGVDPAEIGDFTYDHTLYDAVRHLFRVTAGLDSMLLGETEILGQVRDAYRFAGAGNTTNTLLNTLFQQAIAVGKRVRRETGIDHNASSISYAAVELAKSKFGHLSGCTALIIGAGYMSELAMKNLSASGVKEIIIVNRSYHRAVDLAEQFGGRAVGFQELGQCLEHVDLVISSTAAPHNVVRTDEVRRAMASRPEKPLVLIDLAVPRDIEAGTGELDGVSLYDIDDLESVVDRNLEERRLAAKEGEKIIEEEVDQFVRWIGTQFMVPTIAALTKRGEEIKHKELKKALNRLPQLTDRDRNVLNAMANAIVNQMLHTPITQLKNYALTNEGPLYTEMLQNIFDLNVDN